MNHGLIYVQPKKTDFHQQGEVKLGGAVLQEDGQWKEYLPTDEVQNLAMEPQACVTFGTLNCTEILERKIFGSTTNWSDRFLAYASGTTPQGNNPQKVAETLRKKGTPWEQDWPYTSEINSWAKFYQVPPYDLYTQAQVKFRGNYDFGHSWVSTDPDSMMEALKYSPLGVDVDAWNQKDGYYIRRGTSNHWVCIYGYVEGRYWKVLDSYDNTRKKLVWDYSFTMVKQYTLFKRVLGNDLWSIAIRWLRQWRQWV